MADVRQAPRLTAEVQEFRQGLWRDTRRCLRDHFNTAAISDRIDVFQDQLERWRIFTTAAVGENAEMPAPRAPRAPPPPLSRALSSSSLRAAPPGADDDHSCCAYSAEATATMEAAAAYVDGVARNPVRAAAAPAAPAAPAAYVDGVARNPVRAAAAPPAPPPTSTV